MREVNISSASIIWRAWINAIGKQTTSSYLLNVKTDNNLLRKWLHDFLLKKENIDYLSANFFLTLKITTMIIYLHILLLPASILKYFFSP